jgi:hypothetical protein
VQEAEEVAEVGPGLDAVELAARQEGDEDRVDACALVAAEEQPVLPAEDLATEVALGDVVVEGQAPVVEEATEGDALVAGVAEGLRDRRLVEGDGGLLVAPLEERVEERPRLLAPDLLALLAGRRLIARSMRKRPLISARACLASSGSEPSALKKYLLAVGPACHLDHVAGLVEVVVDGGGVGDEVALVAGEQDVDRLAVVLVRVAVEDVALGRDQDPEVGPPALLLGLDEDAGGIGAQIGRGEGVRSIASTSGSARSASCSCQPHIVDRASIRPSRA